eukprot:5128792-Alexandrium_andersonii.AAC.2
MGLWELWETDGDTRPQSGTRGTETARICQAHAVDLPNDSQRRLGVGVGAWRCYLWRQTGRDLCG